MPGSAMEVRTFLAPRCYKKIRPHYAGKDWEIVAFTSDYFVLRIERENIKFNRTTGKILDRHQLGAKR